jgi:hypothetical protein
VNARLIKALPIGSAIRRVIVRCSATLGDWWPAPSLAPTTGRPVERKRDSRRDQSARDQTHPPYDPWCDGVSSTEETREAAADHLPDDDRGQERQIAPSYLSS